MTTAWSIERAAGELLAAEDGRFDRDPITDEWPDLDISTAYAIQNETLRRREARGEKLIGVKLGLTSRAKQRRMNVDSPLVAWLTDAMILPAGEPVPQEVLIHPRVEPEIVFVMKSRLSGPGVTAAQALTAVEAVYAGAEVIDSRYRDFRFTLTDVIADNASSARSFWGRWHATPTTSTWHWKPCWWKLTERSSTRQPAPRCRTTPPRRWPWLPTTSAVGASPSSRDRSCSPVA